MARKPIDWKIKNEVWHLGERTILTGALNVTPDSEADRGRYLDPDRAFVRGVELADQGADILEIGAESMRPGSERISEAEELRRLIPVLKKLRGKISIPICVETYKAAVAEKALSMGVTIIKDPSGLTLDADLAKVVAQHDAGFVLQHMKGTPETWAKLPSPKEPVGAVFEDLSAAVSRATRSGILRERMVLDPGLGLGKRKEQNTALLIGLNEFSKLRMPVQVSPSGKSFAAAVALAPDLATTVAACTLAILRAAHLVRVHDVAAVRAGVLIVDQAVRG
jgi:dihydropteroate synthase